jgi:hypothetical protein
MKAIWENVTTGVRWGVYFGVVFSAIATVMVIIAGPGSLAEKGYNVGYLGLIALYLVGGFVSGALAGAMLPLCRTTVGVMVTGAVAALPLMFLVAPVVVPREDWSEYMPWFAFIAAAIWGPVCALAIRIGIQNAGRRR